MKSTITPVKDWNRYYSNKGQYMLVYTLGNGSMVDEPRKRGYVVQKRHEEGGERSRFHLNLDKAVADHNSNSFN